MAFTPKTAPYSGRINTVTVGTGHKAMTLGGQNVLPFYTFDAPIEHAPKVGLEISDLAHTWTIPGLKEFYEGCDSMADYAQKAAGADVDFLCLHFEAADPGGANRSVEDCAADAKAVAEAVELPLVISGCKNMEKDGALFAAIAEALEGRNVLIMSAKNEDYQTVGPDVALKHNQKLGAETSDDINLAKQLNIMLKGAGVAEEQIVMDIGTSAVGYGYEYAASTFDRIRLAALEQGDEDLQMPILSFVCANTWGVKESVATEEDEPAWGSQEERAIGMEIATAAADLTGGADAVVLRHPASVAAIKTFIRELI
ncbi:MAG: acetyl-CoA decarbonylase/synthase complex subunit delta [Oscillospiraceae bacterium]|nr:acetyl-CoA decarbonylase/synthase complex subunit delta [Oscillospiraceae bacterium]